MTPADFLAKWGPKVGADRGDMAADLGSVVQKNGDILRAANKRLAQERDELWQLTHDSIEHLERQQNPKGGQTDRFVKRLKRTLRGS